MLDIEKSIEKGKASFSLKGRLDTTSAPALEREFKDVLADVSELMLDFSALEYISSAGLRVLLSAQKLMNKQGQMKIAHVNETVREIFEVTGFSEILTIE